MGSSKDIAAEAKNISASLRQLSKRFFEDFYAKAAKRGHYPWPHEAMGQFGQILKGAAEGEWPPQPPDRPGISPEVFEALLSPRLFQQIYQAACDAHVRHMPGLKKVKRGRKPETELAELIWKLKAEGKTVPQMQAIFRAEGQHFSAEKIESYLKTRRRKPAGN